MKNQITKHLFIILLVLLIGSNLSYSQSSKSINKKEDIDNSKDFIFGSWNLRMGNTKFMRPSIYHSPVLIAKIIHKTKPSILALQELHDDYKTNNGELRNYNLDALVVNLKGMTKNEWEYKIGDVNDSRGQNTGFLWDKKIFKLISKVHPVSVKRHINPLTNRKLWSRIPISACFEHIKTGNKYIIISIHNKGFRNKEINWHRALESKVLVDRFRTLRDKFKCEDIIVSGRIFDDKNEIGANIYDFAGMCDINNEKLVKTNNNELNIKKLRKIYDAQFNKEPSQWLTGITYIPCKYKFETKYTVIDSEKIKELNISDDDYKYYCSSNYLHLVEIKNIN